LDLGYEFDLRLKLKPKFEPGYNPFLNSSRFSNYISTRSNFFFFQKSSEMEDFMNLKKLSWELHPRFLSNQKTTLLSKSRFGP